MYPVIKDLLDRIFALILLILASPIMLIAALVIKLEEPADSVLFKQVRPGKDGKVFSVYKFRTMKSAREKDGKALSDMERMTKLGNFLRKTSIDELPQLFNILRGEMSFIGPRPLLVQYLDKYNERQRRRHDVKPGISGWAQVNGRNAISWEQKFEYDVWYVEKMSFMMDLKIVGLTILKVIGRNDVNANAQNTMEEFKGSD